MLSLPPGSLYSHTFSGTFFPPPSFPLCLAFFSPRNGRRWILRGHTSTNDTTSATAITSSSSLAVVSPSFSPSSHCADGRRRRRRRPKEEGRRRRKEGRRRLLLSPPPQEVLEKQRGGGGGAAASAVIVAVWKEEPFSLSLSLRPSPKGRPLSPLGSPHSMLLAMVVEEEYLRRRELLSLGVKGHEGKEKEREFLFSLNSYCGGGIIAAAGK